MQPLKFQFNVFFWPLYIAITVLVTSNKERMLDEHEIGLYRTVID